MAVEPAHYDELIQALGRSSRGDPTQPPRAIIVQRVVLNNHLTPVATLAKKLKQEQFTRGLLPYEWTPTWTWFEWVCQNINKEPDALKRRFFIGLLTEAYKKVPKGLEACKERFAEL